MEVPSSAPPVPQPRVPAKVVAGIVAAFVLLVVLIAAAQLLWARQHLLAGAQQLDAAIAVVKTPANLENETARDAAIVDLQTARTNFATARGDLVVWSPVLSTLSWVPRYGHLVAAASPLAATAYFATASALDIVNGARPLWSELRDRPHQKPLLERLASAIRFGGPEFQQARIDARMGISSLQSTTGDLSDTTIRADLRKLRHDLPRLQAAAAWLTVMPRVLGDLGTQMYLFCWEDAAEIRPTGGFIGAADLVSLKSGHMAEHFSGSAIERHNQAVPLPLPEAVTTTETTWIFRDSNVSPSFPLSARLERWFYWKQRGARVNGVIDFVDQGIPDILSATGPVYLRQYHVTVDSHNSQALANQYAAVNAIRPRGPLSLAKAGNLDTFRKQFLGFEFAAILHRLQTLPASRWGALGQAMEQAIRSKDILIWSQTGAVEKAITMSDADGALNPSPGDFIYVVDDNRSYNKIGPFVHESASYATNLVPGYWLDSTLTLRYHLDSSPDWIEGLGPALGTQGSKHEFRDFVRVFVPPGAIVQSVPGLNQTVPLGFVGHGLAGQSAYGLTQISGWFTMRPRQTKVLRIRYAIPANDLSFADFRRYRLTIPRQPGTRLQGISVRIQAVGGLRLRSSGGKPTMFVKRWLPLTTNQSLLLQVIGKGQPNLITVSPPRRTDPFIPVGKLPGLY